MSIDVGRIDELIVLAAENGAGVTIRPVQKGEPLGGIGSDDRYQFDGWEIGIFWGTGGDEIAVGHSLAEAVVSAILALQEMGWN